MNKRSADHTLAFLLAFDGRIHRLEKGYWIGFEIKRVGAQRGRPHGLSCSLTLHGPDGGERSLAPDGRRSRQAICVQRCGYAPSGFLP